MGTEDGEKRDHPRVTLNCEARVSDPQTGETFKTMVINMSGGGALFNAQHPFARGTRLELCVEGCEQMRPRFEARIRVMRCEPRDKGGFQVAAVIEQGPGTAGGGI